MIPKITEKLMDQRPPEYRVWTALCVALGIQKYVELGMGGGASANFVKNAGVPNLVAVDLFATREGRNVILDKDIPFVLADSHDPATRDKVLEILNGPPDAVFIDADHSTEAVRKDFELWWPVTKKIMGFHDILMNTVSPFWNEVSLNISSVQIVARDMESAIIWQERCGSDAVLTCGGIGVLFKE